HVRFSASPKTEDPLSFRQAIQCTLVQTSNIAGSSIYLDVLWVVDDGDEMVSRTTKRDSTMIVALSPLAMPRISLQRNGRSYLRSIAHWQS
ncbi:hypothetical protein F5146DRAFT_934572, partial [Armillaria mellea]